MAIKAILDGTLAGNANGLNVALNATLVSDIKSLVPMVQALAAPALSLAPAKV